MNSKSNINVTILIQVFQNVFYKCFKFKIYIYVFNSIKH